GAAGGRHLGEAGGLEAAVGPDAVDQRRGVADLAAGDVEHALLFVEGARGHLGGMRVDGDGGQTIDRGDVAQMLPEVRLVDREIVVERQDDRRDDAMRDVGLVTGHFDLHRNGHLGYYASKYAGEERHDEKLCRCCVRAWSDDAACGRPAASGHAVRTELHAIQTLTLSDKQFL